MAPGEKNKKKFAENIRSCDVEVMFESADGDVAI